MGICQARNADTKVLKTYKEYKYWNGKRYPVTWNVHFLKREENRKEKKRKEDKRREKRMFTPHLHPLVTSSSFYSKFVVKCKALYSKSLA